MKCVLLIAVVLAILFGFSTAANFVSALLIGALVFLLVTAVVKAVMELFKPNIWSAIKWAVAATFWWWILSICY